MIFRLLRKLKGILKGLRPAPPTRINQMWIYFEGEKKPQQVRSLADFQRHSVIRKLEKIAGDPFRRQGQEFNAKELLQREIQFLRLLQGSEHFPKLLDVHEDRFSMPYLGDRVRRETLPKDFQKQIEEILGILKEKKIIHRDIKAQNLLVKDSTLILIDFGWAIFEDEKNRPCPQDFEASVPQERIYDNRRAFQDLIASL